MQPWPGLQLAAWVGSGGRSPGNQGQCVRVNAALEWGCLRPAGGPQPLLCQHQQVLRGPQTLQAGNNEGQSPAEGQADTGVPRMPSVLPLVGTRCLAPWLAAPGSFQAKTKL